MNYKLIGEIVGIIAIIESFFIFSSDRRKNIIILKGISDAIWAVNSFLIKATTGGVLNAVMIFREFVFYHRIDKKWAQHKFWKYFFCVMCFSSPAIEMIKAKAFLFLPLFPACGSVAAVYGFYDKNPTRIRILNFFATIPWLIYSIYTNNITSSISSVVSLVSILFGSLIAKKIKRK